MTPRRKNKALIVTLKRGDVVRDLTWAAMDSIQGSARRLRIKMSSTEMGDGTYRLTRVN